LRITADTNLLVRAVVRDNLEQASSAERVLADASLVAIPVAVFCELAWVLKGRYGQSGEQIGALIRGYLNAETVVTDRSAVEAGLRTLAHGGDFADGAIAQQGRDSGGAAFASFDRLAVRLLTEQGWPAFCP
jgi:predicted nucleic-acid-binding protein